ncbi:DUF1566 domain-containing protein, partial [Candidatus Dojkabacteria bacterium]|nr:DUF1566 domain-containing protein [Candidatus Dojkabacteria bacterium]
MKNKKIAIVIAIMLPVIVALGVIFGIMIGTEKEGDIEDDTQEYESTVTGSVLIPDTAQTHCFNNTKSIDCPAEGEEYYGQDAHYTTNAPSYTDNGDGTVTDNVTGLMWQKDPGEKVEYRDAAAGADNFSLAGYDDWRVPTIKELYSLMNFEGQDPSSEGDDTSGLVPFINDSYFDFAYGDTEEGDRIIDSQWVTSSIYEAKVMNNQECFFGVNFADGRIKCYPTQSGKGYFAIYVRGGEGVYGQNDFVDNGDQTVTDQITGLTWMQNDSVNEMEWKDSLSYCEDLDLSGYADWRLPSAKELQYIVDYSRSPDTTNSPAIDDIFRSTMIKNEKGEDDWGYYWTSTTHIK